jgi:hypothetical protein
MRIYWDWIQADGTGVRDRRPNDGGASLPSPGFFGTAGALAGGAPL